MVNESGIEIRAAGVHEQVDHLLDLLDVDGGDILGVGKRKSHAAEAQLRHGVVLYSHRMLLSSHSMVKAGAHFRSRTASNGDEIHLSRRKAPQIASSGPSVTDHDGNRRNGKGLQRKPTQPQMTPPTANPRSDIMASRGKTAATAKDYLSRTSSASHTNVVMLCPAALHSAVNTPSDTRSFRGLA